MLSKTVCEFIAGETLIDALQIEKDARVAKSATVPGCYDSRSLCDWQSELSRRGIMGVEIVFSIYGASVRYDSGCQNFALLASARYGQLDGTTDAAIAYAKAWVASDPARRYAWIRKDSKPVTVRCDKCGSTVPAYRHTCLA